MSEENLMKYGVKYTTGGFVFAQFNNLSDAEQFRDWLIQEEGIPLEVIEL